MSGRCLRSTGIGPKVDTFSYISQRYFYGPSYLTVTYSILVWPEEYFRGFFSETTSCVIPYSALLGTTVATCLCQLTETWWDFTDCSVRVNSDPEVRVKADSDFGLRLLEEFRTFS